MLEVGFPDLTGTVGGLLVEMDRSSEAEDGKEEADEVAADRLRDDSLVQWLTRGPVEVASCVPADGP